ncbi:glycosyltransferase family 2 protein [Iningainema tapete]|uniref:Glycosyltransferase family 2 protein n=1 Tax=Iningainema tapete BLCC-T55 TaxID=2748662 RepID=A0A8J6XQ84_9CYAN|nr:glycosyltransferase family 2 protein [Iningainema tapete]MBD2774457.1 glycosyltransferase family 2 protein [Iningainema tapete BLCC-T55]
MLQITNSPQPLVSVIIPTYNRVEYLKEALNSAVKQTYQNIEIIVSDNCSTDNTQAVVESFPDSRIRYWRQPTNLGMFANQMYAFKAGRGKYVASLHDDDMWKEDFLEKLVPLIDANPNLILAFCDQYIIDGKSNINHTATEINTKAYKRHLLAEGIYQNFAEIAVINKSIPTAAACVMRNQLIDWDSIPPEVGGMWDLYLSYLCCRSQWGAYYYPERLTFYREHEQTDTKVSGGNPEAKIRKAKNEMFCYERFMEDEQLEKFKLYFKQKWLESNTTLAIGLLQTENTTQARPYLWRAFSEQKFNLRTLAALTLSFTPRPLANQLLGVYAK